MIVRKNNFKFMAHKIIRHMGAEHKSRLKVMLTGELFVEDVVEADDDR